MPVRSHKRVRAPRLCDFSLFALLELIKQRQIRVVQDDVFGKLGWHWLLKILNQLAGREAIDGLLDMIRNKQSPQVDR